MGFTKNSAVKYEIDKVLFETDLWELTLKKLCELPIPSNLIMVATNTQQSNYGENIRENITTEEIKKYCLAGKKVFVKTYVVEARMRS